MSKHITSYRGIEIFYTKDKGHWFNGSEGEHFDSLERTSKEIDSFLRARDDEHADWYSQYC